MHAVAEVLLILIAVDGAGELHAACGHRLGVGLLLILGLVLGLALHSGSGDLGLLVLDLGFHLLLHLARHLLLSCSCGGDESVESTADANLRKLVWRVKSYAHGAHRPLKDGLLAAAW
jgi:hypothetical protein